MSIIILERLIARIENAEKMEYNRCKDFSRQLNDVNKGKTFSEDFKSDLNKLLEVNDKLKTSTNLKKQLKKERLLKRRKIQQSRRI